MTWRAANMPLPAEAPRLGKQLPEYTHFFSDLKDCDGGSVFFAQPALIDLDKAEPEAYALATAELVERHVPRESLHPFKVHAPRLEAGRSISSSCPGNQLNVLSSHRAPFFALAHLPSILGTLASPEHREQTRD